MLLFSLIVSVVLLLVANAAFRWCRAPVAVLLSVGLLSLLPCLAGVVVPAALLQLALLLAVMVVAYTCGWQPRRFAWLSCAASVGVYAVIGFFAWRDVVRLREQFPYQSLEDRLPEPRVHASQPLPAETAERLEVLEESLKDSNWAYRGLMRRHQLERLHEHTLQVFATRPGFGVGRMLQMSPRSLNGSFRDPTPLQPGTRIVFTWSSADLEGQAPPLSREDFSSSWRMHLDGLMNFVRPEGFGYAKDRRHVAGFQSHGFSTAPVPEQPWSLQTVDLIGLLQHDEPAVYVTDHLPRMEELRDAPWRHADDFERMGLQALRDGADLFVRDGREGRRMLGALRNVSQCSTCHGGERGDLLGAFSYTLARIH